VNLAAAPYDFRRTPHSNPEYAKQTYALIEDLYERNHGAPVALVSHSLGGLVTLYLLNQKDAEWKRKYIDSWTPIAGVFGGTANLMKLHASGDNQFIPTASRLELRGGQRSYETNLWMLPNARVWANTRVLVTTPVRQYTVRDYADFFADIGYPEGFAIHQTTSRLTGELKAPEVRVNLVISRGVDTVESLVYREGDGRSWMEHEPESLHGDGDGVVNVDSLYYPTKWTTEQTQQVTLHEFEKIDHMGLIRSEKVIDWFIQTVVNNPERSTMMKGAMLD
jgi:lysophospholipase-3